MELTDNTPSTGPESSSETPVVGPSAGMPESPNDPANRQAAMLAFGHRTNVRHDLSVMMQDAVSLVAEVLKADLCGVGLVSADGAGLQLSVAPVGKRAQPSNPITHEYTLDTGDSLAAAALVAARPIVTSDISTETEYGDQYLQGIGVVAAMTVPLHLHTEPFGVLGIYCVGQREFPPEDVCFAETIAHLLTASIARVHAEEALREEQTRSCVVWETVDALIMTLDANGRVTDINPACAEVTRFSIDEVRDRHFWSVFTSPEEADLIRGIFRGSKSGRVPSEFEGSLLAKDGSRRQVSWSLKTLCNGQVQSVILIGTDKTECIQTKQELERVKSVAEQTTKRLRDIYRKASEGRHVHDVLAADLDEAGTDRTPDEKIGKSPLPFQPIGEKKGKDFRNSVRRAYPYRQKIAPMIDGLMPSPDDFITVRCKDISGGGISFLLDQRPDFKDLVVAVGYHPRVIYFLARVVRVATIEQEKQTKYLVGCRLSDRVSL